MSDNTIWSIDRTGQALGLDIAHGEPSHIHVARPGRVQRANVQTEGPHFHAAYAHTAHAHAATDADCLSVGASVT